MKLRVLEVCKNKGLTLKELSEKLGISNVGLSQQINGNPTIDTLQKIADALNVPITDLFDQPKANVFNCPKCGAKLNIEVDNQE